MSQNRNAHSVVIFPLGTHFLKDIPKWFLSQVSCYKLHDVGVPLSILFSPHGLSRIQEVEESEKGQSPHQAMSLHAPWLPDLKWFRVDDLCSRTVSIHSMVNCFWDVSTFGRKTATMSLRIPCPVWFGLTNHSRCLRVLVVRELFQHVLKHPLSIYLSIYIYICNYMSIYLCIFVCIYIYVFIYLFTMYLLIYQSAYVSIYLPIHQSIDPSICISMIYCIWIYTYLSYIASKPISISHPYIHPPIYWSICRSVCTNIFFACPSIYLLLSE